MLKYFVFLIDLIDGSSEEVKVEPESVKRRKTEWHAGLQKMAGDTTLCKEWWVCGLPAFSILARTGCCDKDQNYNYNIYICMYVCGDDDDHDDHVVDDDDDDDAGNLGLLVPLHR